MSDPGLQSERTAWPGRHTQLTLLAGALLLRRTTGLQGSPGTQVLVALLALVAVAAAEWQVRRLMQGCTAAIGRLATMQLLACGGLCPVGLLRTH